MLYALKPPAPKAGSEWVTLAEKVGERAAIEVLAKPVGRIEKRIAQRAASAVIVAAVGDGEVDDRVQAQANDAYGRALIAEVVEDWRGLGDAEGSARPFDAAGLALLLDDDFLFDRAWSKIALPVLAEEAEKNGFAPSPGGTGSGATPASGTASSPASRRQKRAAAKGARTGSTRSKPARPKPSGTS